MPYKDSSQCLSNVCILVDDHSPTLWFTGGITLATNLSSFILLVGRIQFNTRILMFAVRPPG